MKIREIKNVVFNKVILSLILVLVCLVFAFSNNVVIEKIESANAESSVMIRTPYSTQKITQEEDISAYKSGKLEISAAKGETEGGQIIFRPDKDVARFEANVSDLVCGDFVIGKNNVDVYAQVYTFAQEQNWSKTLPAGHYPDALIPVQNLANRSENVIKNSNNQGFWIDINVPKDAAAGIYGGEFTAIFDGKEFKVDITLTVYDFVMPDTPAMRSCYLIWQDWLIDGELDNTTEKAEIYYDTLLKYNISPNILGVDAYTRNFPAQNVEEYKASLRKYYSKIACYAVPYRTVDKTSVGRYILDREFLKTYLNAIVEISKEDGVNYFNKAYYYFDLMYDEVTTSEEKLANFEQVLKDTDKAEEELINELVSNGVISADGDIANSIKNMYHIVPALEQVIDGYNVDPCPRYNTLTSTLTLEKYRQYTINGCNVSSYGCIKNDFWPFPSNQINDYVITTRDAFWRNFEYKIDGELLWCVNAYVNYNYFSGARYGKRADMYHIACGDSQSNGDGYMLYPGRLYGSDNPFPSLRLTAKRDGIDDYTYMSILDSLYREHGLQNGANSIISFINKTILGRGASKLNYSGLANARETIAKLIIAAMKGVFIDDIGYSGNNYYYKISAAKNVDVNVNGKEVPNEYVSEKIPQNGFIRLTYGYNNEFDEISVYTVSAMDLIYGFNSQTDINKVKVYTEHGSTVALSAANEPSISGNSLKVKLQGKVFDKESNTLAFRPRVQIPCELTEKNSVKFSVYSNQSVEIDICLWGEGRFVYDTVKLKAGQWREIIIDNKYIVDRASGMQGYSFAGLQIANPINGSEISSVTLFIDDFYAS